MCNPEHTILWVQAGIMTFQLLVFFLQLRSMNGQKDILRIQTNIQSEQNRIIEKQLRLSSFDPKSKFLESDFLLFQRIPAPPWKPTRDYQTVEFYEATKNQYDQAMMKARRLFSDSICNELNELSEILKSRIDLSIDFFNPGRTGDFTLSDFNEFWSDWRNRLGRISRLIEDDIKISA